MVYDISVSYVWICIGYVWLSDINDCFAGLLNHIRFYCFVAILYCVTVLLAWLGIMMVT